MNGVEAPPLWLTVHQEIVDFPGNELYESK